MNDSPMKCGPGRVALLLLLAPMMLLSGCAAANARTPAVRIPVPQPPRPVPELVAQLSAPDAPSRTSAAWSLAGAGDVDTGVVAALERLLDDPSEPVREAATWALTHISAPGFDRDRLTEVPPKAQVITQPVYPPVAYSKKIQGTVLVTFLINAIGRVAHAEISESIPDLDRAALSCVREWQFEPAKRAGRPVASVAIAPVTFRIY